MEHIEPLFLEHGDVLGGRYRIQGILGEGGFALVYEAMDLRLERAVALKALKFADPAPCAVQRFEREARWAASLHHPGIVRVQDFGHTEDGAPYFVMELLEGYSLEHELWQHGEMSWERAVTLLRPCLHALSHAHERGLIHRDLTPANLFLVQPHTPAETLVILDFGLGFFLGDAERRFTSADTTLGTPGYIAPEYLLERQITPALDVYQMGLILAQVTTGRSPEQLVGSPPGPLNPEGLSPVSVDVLTRALDVSPAQRFAHAGALLDALLEPAQILEDLPAPAPAKSQVARLWLPVIALLVVLLLARTFVTPTAPPSPTPSPQVLEPVPVLTRASPATVTPATKTDVSPKPAPKAALSRPTSKTPQKRPITEAPEDPLDKELRWIREQR